MRQIAAFVSALALVLGGMAVQSAEDHAEHQHEQRDQHKQHAEPESQEHGSHQQHTEQRSHQEHAQHGAAADPHAQHANTPQDEPTESERRHIPPDPPQRRLHDMSNEEMIELMQMEDNAPYSMWLLDQFEWREIEDENALVWDAQAWYGTDYNKAWLKVEAERVEGEYEGRAELLWDRILSRWWHVQAGVRQDLGDGPSRTWVRAAGPQLVFRPSTSCC
jgi:copper resistance protein B